MEPALRAAVLTVSDGVTHGTRVDASGDLAEALVRAAGFDVVDRSVVPDERPEIEAKLRAYVTNRIELVVTTGGTGFGPRDVTPEATRAVIEREAPGLAELMRREGIAATPFAALSRGIAGAAGGTLIVNTPGSPKGVRESLEAVLPVATHAAELLAGQTGSHPTGHAASSPDDGAHRSPTPSPVGHRHASGRSSADAGPRPARGPRTVTATAVKIHGSPPCSVGSRLLIGPEGPLSGTLGCAEFDAAAVADAPGLLASGEATTRTYHHDLGDVEVFLEADPIVPRLVVGSATPVAAALLRFARDLGYETVLVEPRGERVTPEHRMAADEIRTSLDGAGLDGETDVVLTDHDAPDAAGSAAAALRSPARFVGVMGSRRHVGPHVESLRSQGFSDEDLARLRSPVGLDLGAKTPEEIALSIAAGLVAARAGRAGGWLDRAGRA